MRLALVAVPLLVVGLGAVVAADRSNRAGSVGVVGESTYRDPLSGEGVSPKSPPQQSASAPPAPLAATTPSQTAPATARNAEAPATSATTLLADPRPAGEGTALVSPETLVFQGGPHREEETDDEFPALGEGEFPVSANLPNGTDYPLGDMVALAVEVLAAETTGQGREGYPHLADQVVVCCADLVIDGAAVLFGASETDPATIIIEWHARDVADGVHIVRASTQTRWRWVGGTWLGEFASLQGSGA